MPTTTIHIDTIAAGEPGTIEAEVFYTFHKGSLGKREAGVPMEPDEDAFVELRTIDYKHHPIDLFFLLSQDQLGAIADKLLEEEG